MLEEIELASQFKARRFRQAEVLLQADIPIIDARPEQDTASGVSEKPGLRRGEARRSEPLRAVRTHMIAKRVVAPVGQGVCAVKLPPVQCGAVTLMAFPLASVRMTFTVQPPASASPREFQCDPNVLPRQDVRIALEL